LRGAEISCGEGRDIRALDPWSPRSPRDLGLGFLGYSMHDKPSCHVCEKTHGPSMISVILPVYNRRDLVGRAIRSVLGQKYVDWEVVVVDDGSEDGTAEGIEDEFGDAVRLLRKHRNEGVSAARNLGIREARGEWLALLDSDDEWLPQKLQRQVEALAQSKLLICHSDEIWIRNGVRVNPHKHHRKFGGDIFFKALPLCVMSPSSIVIHHSVFARLGLFDERLPACEDYEFFLRLTANYEVDYVAEKLLLKYGGHADQLSRAHAAMDRFRVYALDKLLTAMPALEEEKRDRARSMLIKKARIVAGGAKKRDNHSLADEMQQYLDCWERKE